MSRLFAERDLKTTFREMFDACIKREMPNNLSETQFMEYADLQYYVKMREMQTALENYVDIYQERLNEMEKQIDDLNKKLLEKGVIEN